MYAIRSYYEATGHTSTSKKLSKRSLDMPKNNYLFIFFSVFFLTLFFMPPSLEAGHLEPFKHAAPFPRTNPQTPEKIELGRNNFV